MHYWLVRHDKSFREEISGNYIWAPVRSSGKTPHPILGLAAGDLVLSCANGRIAHVGRVADRAVGEPGRDGEGWWLPVDWTALPNPVASAASSSARIAGLPESRFHALLAEAGLPGGPPPAIDPGPDPARVSASRLDYDPSLAASVRDRQVKARRGQSLFRFRVFRIEHACRLTGVANPDLLIASHIKPWRLCETTPERLDGANGLLLTPHVDRLFDRGLISFADDGAVLRAPALAADDLNRLGLAQACRRNAGAFTERQRAYLAWHRTQLFGRGR